MVQTQTQNNIWIINTEPVVTNPASITSAPSPTSGVFYPVPQD